jgi:hypothetical protein
VPNLIALDWHLRNRHENYGLLSGKDLFQLIKMGWVTLADIRGRGCTRATARRSRTTTTSRRESLPICRRTPEPGDVLTPSRRVRLPRQAGLYTRRDHVADSEFFGYNPTGFSDDEGEGEATPHIEREPEREPGIQLPLTPPVETASASASGDVEAEEAAVEAVVEEPRPKRRKVKGAAKARSRAKPKPLRRESPRPEV